MSIINQSDVFKGEKYVQNYLKLIKQGPLLLVLSAKDVHTNPELSVLLLRIIVLKLFMTGILILEVLMEQIYLSNLNTKLIKNTVPCQAVHNSLEIHVIPDVFVCLNRFEPFLI